MINASTCSARAGSVLLVNPQATTLYPLALAPWATRNGNCPDPARIPMVCTLPTFLRLGFVEMLRRQSRLHPPPAFLRSGFVEMNRQLGCLFPPTSLDFLSLWRRGHMLRRHSHLRPALSLHGSLRSRLRRYKEGSRLPAFFHSGFVEMRSQPSCLHPPPSLHGSLRSRLPSALG